MPQLDEESAIIIGLFHDVGKVGIEGKPYFLVKEAPSKYEAASQKSVSSAVSTVVSVAQAAFEKIAENFSVNVTDRNYLSVILAKILPNNELYKNDKGIAQWTVSSFEAVAAMKNHQNVKQAGTWNKVGSKIQTGFSLFK